MGKIIYFSPMANNINDWVKQAMVGDDICHREEEFTKILQEVRKKILEIVKGNNNYTTVMYTGSGTAALEAIFSSLPNDKGILILDNGHYGKRIHSISDMHHMNKTVVNVFNNEYDISAIENSIRQEEIDYVAMVHHETSTGTLNPLRKIGQLCKKYNKKLIVDAISSIAVHDVNMVMDNISFLAGSSNKGIAGPEGLSFVVANKKELEDYNARSYYFNLNTNYKKQEKGQTLFTPAVRIFQGFNQALDLLKEEGIENRQKRFVEIAFTLRNGMKELGFEMLTKNPSNVTTLYNLGNHDFNSLHKRLKSKGFVIYTGMDNKTFRLCTFGEIKVEDIKSFLEVIKEIK